MYTMAMLSLLQKNPHVSADLMEELTNNALEIKGTIPSWLAGSLIRNGPINVQISGQSNFHWFDGLAMLHAFSFYQGSVSYTNKFLRTDAYKAVFENGSLDYLGFATDPCRSLFKRLTTWFVAHSEAELHNANINITKIANDYVALTEIPLPVRFDPKTLETLGVLNYQDELPKDKCWESAHPHNDGLAKETLNYLIEYGTSKSSYNLYRIKDGSSQRKLIAQIPVKSPAYMHSFAMTDNYVIFTEFPLLVKPVELMVKDQPFIKNFSWHPEQGTTFIVINRHSGKLVGSYKTKPFFAFHHANAYEEGDKIHLDIVSYGDADIILGNYLETDAINKLEAPANHLERFTLSLKNGQISCQTLFSRPNEFPRINQAFDGKRYRYLYLIDPRFPTLPGDHLDKTLRPIYKLDVTSKKVLEWSEEGCYPGEPVFAAAPKATSEDDGVILTVVLDNRHTSSFLLVLNAKNLKELGRATVSHQIPEGLHGQYYARV